MNKALITAALKAFPGSRTIKALCDALEKADQERNELAAESARLLPKAVSELSSAWMLHKYWVGINAALMHLEMGRVAAAQEWLIGTITGPGIERQELEEVDDIDAWAEHQNRGSISHSQALEIIKAEAPETNAALAEVEAKAIDNAIERITSVMKHPEVSQVVNTLKMFVDVLEAFKKELREGRV